MLKNKIWLGIILSIILLIFSINGFTAYYKYTQESGANFYVGTGDKADALEDTNEIRQILDDLGNLLGHSKRDDLYPKNGTTGGYLGRLNYGLDASKPAVPVANDMYLATDTVKVYRCFVAGNWVEVYPGAGGITTFLELTDTPASYTGKEAEILRVNTGANGVEFSGITIETTLTVDSNYEIPTSQAVNTFCETTKDYKGKNYYSTLSTDHTYSDNADTDSQPVGESVTFGDLLYFNWTDKEWKKAKADAYATAKAERIALESKADGETCLMLVKGYIRDDSAFDFGASVIFLNDETAGTCDDLAPAESGDQIQVVGTAGNADILFFNPSQDVGEI